MPDSRRYSTPLDPSQVSVCLVTIGDVDLAPILATVPAGCETVIWDNSRRTDYRVFGRYMATLEATRPVIYTQDDDCVIPIADVLAEYRPGVVTGNLIRDDPAWRARYHDTTLLGFGAVFDRELPWVAFMRWARLHPVDHEFMTSPGGAEVVFPMLSETRTVVCGGEWLGEPGQEVFGRSNRMSNQPGFLETRLGWLDRAREARDRLRKEGVL